MEIEHKGILHGIAHHIETGVRNTYHLDQGALGGEIDAGEICTKTGSFFYCIMIILLNYYHDNNKTMIDDFIRSIEYLREVKLKDLENDVASHICSRYDQLLDELE